jgi:hypothetical protein
MKRRNPADLFNKASPRPNISWEGPGQDVVKFDENNDSLYLGFIQGLGLEMPSNPDLPPETFLKTLRTLMRIKELLRSICSDDDLESWSDWIADIDSTVLRIGKSASENRVQQHFIENRVILLLANQIRSKIGMIRVDIRDGTRPPYCVRTKPSQK